MNKITLHILALVTIFGFIAPYLVSAKNNELAISGILLIVGTVTFYINKAISFIKKESE